MTSGQGQTSSDNPDYAPPRPLEEFDPGLIDTITPNAVRMRNAMAIAIDESRSEEERLAAFDDMELLILTESLAESNDIDMEVLKLWEPILNLTTSPIPTISSQALWVIGATVEHKPESQTTFLQYEPFPTIINTLSRERSTVDVREKALYLLYRTLRHNREALVKFTEANGWEALKAALGDPHITVRQKTACLLNTLLLPSTPSSLQTFDLVRNAIDAHNILSSLTSSLASPKPSGRTADQTQFDADYERTAVQGVVTYLEGTKRSQTDVGEEVKKDLRTILGERKTERGKRWRLEEEEWDVLKRAC